MLTRGLDENGELRDAIAHSEQFKDSPLGLIPTEWEVAPLKAKQIPGFPCIKTGPFGSSLKGEHWVQEGVPVITIGSIGEGEFIQSELLFISEFKAKSLSAYTVKEGDLVFSRVADVGRSVVVSSAEDGWIMSSNLMRISLDRNLVNPTFAYLNIVHNEITRKQIRQTVNSGGREIANTAVLDSLQFCWSSKGEQQSFRDVLLTERLHKAIRQINLDDHGHQWLDDGRINTAIGTLERLGTAKLMEANQIATDLLLKGTVVEGDPQRDGGRDQTVRFIDFDHLDRNDFLIINQFRVNVLGDRNYIVPDIVLFVNGIPLVVIECKSPRATEPMAEGITQLRRYSNQREEIEDDEGAERLFHYNQFLVSTFFHAARVGTIGASYEHYLEWKDTSPVPIPEVAASLGETKLSSQQILVAGMLHPAHLLDLIRNFTLFQQSGGKNIKIVARYQQFRAVQEAVRRLQNGQTRRQNSESDQRGGIIWHTQGSGKSLTMVFLVRKLRTLPELRRFKVVVVTDRVDLERQLSNTASAEDIQGALISLKDELPKLGDRYQRVLAVFQGQGIPDITDVNACIDLLRDMKIRAEFVVKLKQFWESLDIVMPRPSALPYIRDAKILGYINKAAANLYRDFQLNLHGAGNKVRQLIDEYIVASGIDPQVPPISIMDTDFESAVNSRTSDRAKASEMEHAARYHISKNFQEDPAYYKKLSERLEEILEKFQDKWAELVEALRQFTQDLRQGRPADETGLDPRTQAPFLGILVEEIGSDGEVLKTELDNLAAMTVEIVEHIRQEIRIVDFWRNTHAQNVLRGWIVRFLDDLLGSILFIGIHNTPNCGYSVG